MTEDNNNKPEYDFDFNEAMHRVAQTDPREVEEEQVINSIDDLIQRFENASQKDDEGNEFWCARDMCVLLGYKHWEGFREVIKKAKKSCENAHHDTKDHFRHVPKMVEIGSQSLREIEDYQLGRYACYLIAQNGDSRKKEIAFAQTYFAIQTRRQELADEGIIDFSKASEDQRRLYLRNQVVEQNKQLASTAKSSGVRNYGMFQNSGYQGLYGGRGVKEIRDLRGLGKKEQILDFMGSTELAANLFRITQTEEKLRKDNVHNESLACHSHYEVGVQVRKSMREISGIVPEQLPMAEDVKKVARLERNKQKQRSISPQKRIEAPLEKVEVNHVEVDLRKDLQNYCLLIMASQENGEATIATLMKELPSFIELPKEVLEPLKGRKDSKLSQLVRNLKSHKDSKTNMIYLGYAEGFRGGFKITNKGRVFIREYFKDVK